MTPEESALCELCGEPMPEAEQMFKFHGYSGPCPKPPLSAPAPETRRVPDDLIDNLDEWASDLRRSWTAGGDRADLNRFADLLADAAQEIRSVSAALRSSIERAEAAKETALELVGQHHVPSDHSKCAPMAPEFCAMVDRYVATLRAVRSTKPEGTAIPAKKEKD